MALRKNAIIAALSGIGLVAGTLLLTPAYANPDYPTAAEVAAAKRDVQEKEKLIERIEGILVTLEEEARALETIALKKNEEYNQAIDAKNEMAAKVESLQARVEQSSTEAEEARLQLGRIVAQMFRDRSATDTTLELLFNPNNAENLLFQMSMEELIAQRTEAIYQAALDKQAQAEALALELEQSRIELEDIEAEAEQLYQEAQDAADAVIAKVAQSERERATMMEQLAELKDTAEEIERQRQEGLEWERRQAAIRAAPTAPELYSVGEPDWAQVETAIAFASEQLGERYVLGGAGPNVWDCSGITMKSYAAAGVYIGWHSATAQYNVLAGQKKLVPFQNAQRGDLIWWSTESAFSGDKYHVAIYLGDGMMLEAPNPARTVRIVPVRYGELWPYAGRPTATSN
ncbi:NlpC/P60 family protein [Aquiluna sp.]|jgi:cell wall-associated NlpC family hydrolase|nr:NlpC/P60 family protein [Aquiluna sp.]MDA8796431.1 NlpC/P60 family protein [Aquiluna sp.]